MMAYFVDVRKIDVSFEEVGGDGFLILIVGKSLNCYIETFRGSFSR